MNHFVCGRIDLRDGDLEHSRPDITLTECNLASCARNAELDVRDELFRFDVDTRNGAVTLVQGPDRTSACREETRLRADLDFIGNRIASRIDTGDQIVFSTADPDGAVLAKCA